MRRRAAVTGAGLELFPVLMNREKLRRFLAGALPRRQTGPAEFILGPAEPDPGAASAPEQCKRRRRARSAASARSALCAGPTGRGGTPAVPQAQVSPKLCLVY